ncbi:hypothetical protein GCM10010439_30220 [Actinocorallia aurantiaca]|uniref:Uncharacterized protein n=1 Tax=Actinocorallia aurantiaca TaxID=46204 RepID=A0ABN3U8M8_9ACTN
MMKPTRGNTNPPEANTSPLKPGQQCSCAGPCALHEGPCLSRHLRYFPGTRTRVYLDAQREGRCRFCLLATDRPNTVSSTVQAALRRPFAQGQQDDLFDTAPYQRTGDQR